MGYYLLTGSAVFTSTEVAEILKAHLHELPEPPSTRLGRTIPEDLELLVLGCLAKDPNDRPRSAAALDAMLAEADVGEWSAHDAEIWWSEFAEAVHAEAVTRSPEGATSRSQIRVASGIDVSRVAP